MASYVNRRSLCRSKGSCDSVTFNLNLNLSICEDVKINLREILPVLESLLVYLVENNADVINSLVPPLVAILRVIIKLVEEDKPLQREAPELLPCLQKLLTLLTSKATIGTIIRIMTPCVEELLKLIESL